MPLGVAGPKSKGSIRTYLFLVMCLFVVSLCPIGWAQSTASLRGVVLDPADALVPGASVVLQNVGTTAVLNMTTDGQGRYQFLQVMPGTYRIRATMAGFRDVSVSDFQLLVNTPAVLNLKFVRLDGPDQRIEVRVPPINAVDATIGNTIQHAQIVGLPLEGRNVADLLSLQPGVVFTGVDDRVLPDTRTGAVNGARGDQTTMTLDGINVNDEETGAAFRSVLPTSSESTREFRMITASATANFGRSSGGQAAIVTQSGENAFHGSVFENHRNTATTANNFFNNSTIDPITGKTLPRPKLLRNIFGGSIGGPIKKQTLFFYFNFEDTIARREEPQLRVVPSETLREGTLRYFDISGNVQSITPEALQVMDPLGIGPNSAVLALLRQYPHGNDPDQGGDVGLNFMGFRFNGEMKEDKPSYIGRIDYVSPNSVHNLFIRGSLADHQESEQAPQFPGQPAARILHNNSNGFAIGHTWNISPELINNVRWGFTRQDLDFTSGAVGPGLNLRGMDSLQNFSARNYGRNVPVHNITEDLNWISGRHTLQFGMNFRNIHNKRYSEEKTYPLYASNVGFMENSGVDVLPGDIAEDFQTPYLNAQLALLGTITQIDSTYFVDRHGDTFPAPHTPRREFISNEFESYIQDQWKVSPTLTLTAGLRYSYATPPYEKNGLQVRPTLDIHNWFERRRDGGASGVPSNENSLISFVPAGKANGEPTFFDPDTNNFAPRFALAWIPSFSSGPLHALLGDAGHSSVRFGVSLFYDHMGGVLPVMMDQNGSFGMSVTGVHGVANYVTAPRFNGMENLPLIAPTQAPVSGYPATPDFTYNTNAFVSGFMIDTKLRTPYSTVFNLSISRELPWDVTLETAYVGRVSKNLLVQADTAAPLVNFKDPVSGQTWMDASGIIGDLMGRDTPVSEVPSIPFFENVFAPLADPTLSASQAFYQHMLGFPNDWTSALRVLDIQDSSTFGQYTFFQQQFDYLPTWTNLGQSSYHSLQVIARKRFGQGIQADFNYTLSKGLDNGSSVQSEGAGGGALMNGFNHRQSLGYSDFDVRHQINSNFMFDVPVGRNQHFVSNPSPLVNTIIGGWRLTGILRWRTGFPFSNSFGNGFAYPTNFFLNGPPTLKPGVDRPKTKVTKGEAGGPNIFVNPDNAYAAFEHTRSGYSGSRNALRGPGFFTLDTGVQKAFSLGRAGEIQFRWEVFNVTNTANFDGRTYATGVRGIDFDLDAKSSFGRLRSLAGSPRVMQFALRYQF